MKRIVCSAVAVLVGLIASGSAAPIRAAEVVPFMTAGAGGGAFIMGAGMVSVANKYNTAGIRLTHEATSGTLEMVRKLTNAEKQKKPAFAMFGTTEAYDAYKGLGDYKGKPVSGLRDVCSNQEFGLHLIVSAKSGIKSYNDLKGKRIAIGGPGSSVATMSLTLLEAYGITKKDFKFFYYSYREMVEGIADGSLDGGFIPGAYPVAAVTEIATTHDVRILPVDEKIADQIIKNRPGYIKMLVKGKSYKGTDQDVLILAWTSGVHTHAAMPDPIVYGFLKNLFEHLPDFYPTHITAKNLTKETALKGLTLPLHPAAQKYMKEIGAIK